MTHTSFKHTGLKLASFFVIAAFLNSNIASGNTAKHTTGIEIISADTLSKVVFLGNPGDGLLFNVAVKNTKASTFTLTITDGSGTTLFSKLYSDVNFDKNFRLEKTEEKGSYYFQINFNNTALNQTFLIKTSSREIADIAITKL